MREHAPTPRPHPGHPLTPTLLLTAAILGCVLFFAPDFALADGPVNVNTIVSSSGKQWNAPPSAEPFFPSYAPANAPEANHPSPIPEFGGVKQILAPRAPGSVIGKDGRSRIKNTQTFPYRSIVFLLVDFDLFSVECTGTLIGPHTVATAGHCVRDPSMGWAKGARIYPALNGNSAPYNSANAIEFYSVTGWIESYQPEFDYGAVQLDRDIGTETGWLGMTVMDKSELTKTIVRITGYPADKPSHTMWSMSGPIRRVSPLRLFYDIDTYAGQSGAPIYKANLTRACGYCIVGIHGYGVGGDRNVEYNSGVRITPAVLNNFVSWRKLP